jgi:diguanylate cyclase (GGDEF)-like protein
MPLAMPLDLDPLTGLPFRDAFMDALAAALDAAKKKDAPSAIAVIDIDLFGSVNERVGREAADEIIRQLARSLAACVGGKGRVFRYGGDALSVAFDGVAKEQAFLTVEQFRESLPSELAQASHASGITISAGVAARPDDGEDARTLAHKANEALYRAKVSGRNQVCLAREEKMVTKTSHYTLGQLLGLRRLAERKGVKDAELLREALNDLLLKHNA